MTPEAIAKALKDRFPDAVSDVKLEGAHPRAVVKAEQWPAVAKFLRDDPKMGFNWLRCVSAVDYLEDNVLAAVYDLHSARPAADPKACWRAEHEFAVQVSVPRGDPRIPSVANVWPAADWHEREAYDLMGIIFENHPDSIDSDDGPRPRRILCPEDWQGHPLRKDYEFPLEYNGIPAVTEFGQTRPQH